MIKIKNNIDTELTIAHRDNQPAKTLYTDELTVAVNTVTDMEAITTPADGDTVIVKDLNRGGTFVYDSTKVSADNQGTNFNGWIRLYSGAVNVKWFGAKGDGVTDDTLALNGSCNILTSGGSIYLPAGKYSVSSFTITNDNIKIYGDGFNTTTLIGTDTTGKWIIDLPLNQNVFRKISISDLSIEGKPNTYTSNGISTYFTVGNNFTNLSFKYLNTCIRGVHTYSSVVENIKFQEYNIGIRGLLPAETSDFGVSKASDAPFAESSFISLDFFGGNTTTGSNSYAINGSGFNSSSFFMSTFAGNTLNGIDLSTTAGMTFNTCRFERLKPNVTWITINNNCSFHDCEVYTDGRNHWYVGNDSSIDTWAFLILGNNNIIDSVSPEYPRYIIKLGADSSSNTVRWSPVATTTWDSNTLFYLPILDEGTNNEVNYGYADKQFNNSIVNTSKKVSNYLIGSNDQSCFALTSATKLLDEGYLNGGPSENGLVYKYTRSGTDRYIYGNIANLIIGNFYTFSAWISLDVIEKIECIFGSGIGDANSYVAYKPTISSKWIRVTKTIKAGLTSVVAGFRLGAASTTNLWVSQPQVVDCGTSADGIFAGAYVASDNSITSEINPNSNKAFAVKDYTATKVTGVTYTNTSSKTIEVNVVTRSSTSGFKILNAYINGAQVFGSACGDVSYDKTVQLSVPAGYTYKVEWTSAIADVSVTKWIEIL